MNDDGDIVRALLSAAGIHPSEDEIRAMIRVYPGLRSAADALYCEEAALYLPAFHPTDSDMEAK